MKLGLILRKYRAIQELTVRELAADIGIHFTALSRVENGDSVDAQNLMKIFNWLVAEQKQA
jgi:transcriptional regulator with XRE-family HTH domain